MNLAETANYGMFGTELMLLAGRRIGEAVQVRREWCGHRARRTLSAGAIAE